MTVYGIAAGFPPAEMYGLTSQIRRAVTSVPANIAEGAARSTSKDFAGFVSIARGSLAETETLLDLAVRLGYITQDEHTRATTLSEEVGRMLTMLRRSLTALGRHPGS